MRWLAVILSVALALIPSVVHASGPAPVVKSLSLTPTVINIGFGGPAISLVHVKMEVTDPVGLNYGILTLAPPVGSVGFYNNNAYFDTTAPYRTSGTDQDGIYEFDVPFYQFTAQGDWTASVYLYSKGNYSNTVTQDQLRAMGFDWRVSALGGADTTPPSLVSVNFAPGTVDTTGGSAVVTVNVHVKDLGAGFGHGNFLFIAPPCAREPDGEVKGYTFYSDKLVSGDIHDGTYQFTVELPQYEVDGPWSIRLEMYDALGNPVTLTSQQIEGLVNNGGPAYLNVIGTACVQSTGTLTIDTICTDSNPLHGLGNVPVTVVGPNGPISPSPVTDDHGHLSLILPTGDYIVIAPATAGGLLLNGTQTQTATVTSGGASVSFHYVGATISGRLYWDADYDNAYTPGVDVPLGGIQVHLINPATGLPVTDDNGHEVLATTDVNGNYAFAGICLEAGSYQVTTLPEINNAQTNNQPVDTQHPTQTATVTEGGSDKKDFPYQPKPGSLSGTLFYDANKNGIQDNGENGIGGVTVTLTDSLNNQTTTTTDTSGKYSFTNLKPGSYSVSAPSSADSKDLESSKTPSPINGITVVAGQSSGNNNFAYVVGSISGTVYFDANANGSLDNGDTGISGVTVTLADQDGNTIATTSSGPGGSYSFTGLAAGTYHVSVPSSTGGMSLKTTSPAVVTVDVGQDVKDVNFGYVTGSISGTVFMDLDKNGALGPGEPGIGGVTVTLTKPGGAQVTTTTASDGTYSFGNLTGGTYSVSVPATVGTKTLTTSGSRTVSLPAGGNSPNNNFGYADTVGSISGIVYFDANTNKAYNSGIDTPMGGVTVLLLDAGHNVIAQTTSGANGSYVFTGLQAGTYYVSVPATANGKNLETASPLQVTLSSGQNSTNNNFGYIAKPSGKGATRTWGFWKTHLTAFTSVVSTGLVNLGSITVTPAQNGTNPPVNTTENYGSDLKYFESIFATSPGTSQTTLGQARLQLAHQLLAAMANTAYLGTTTQQNGKSATLIADALAALQGTDVTKINKYVTPLDNFNTSGDNVGFPTGKSEGSADPAGAQAAAYNVNGVVYIPGFAFK
jgi:hypothetical protein